MQPIVSIVVPTHNRSRYAIRCVESLLAIPSDRIEVMVHDTSNDAMELKDWATVCGDKRLIYVHHPDRLSMTENHERALNFATGSYICVIGDDDSVSSEIVTVADFAMSVDMTLVSPKLTAVYSWPDFKTRFFKEAHAGKLYVGDFSYELERRSCDDALRAALRRACQDTDGLPKLYHGLVRKDLLDDLKRRNGQVFFGTSPDMSAAIGLAVLAEHFHVIDVPFILPGASGGSNTGRSALNKHKGDIKSDPHMSPFRDLTWPDELPRFFSVETVWAHSGWETLAKSGVGSPGTELEFAL